MAETLLLTGPLANAASSDPAGSASLGQAAGGSVLPPAHHGPVDIHAALNQVRTRPEFQPKKPGPLDDLLENPALQEWFEKIQRGLDEFFRALNSLLRGLNPTGKADMPELMMTVLTYAFWTLVVFLALMVVYVSLGALKRLLEKPHTLPPGVMSHVFDQSLLVNARHHQQEADRLAGQGQWEAATRQLYLASLCMLDEKRLVPFEATRSNGEYLSALKWTEMRQLPPLFRALIRPFEAVRYGRQSVLAEAYQDYRRQYEAFRQEVSMLPELDAEAAVHG